MNYKDIILIHSLFTIITTMVKSKDFLQANAYLKVKFWILTSICICAATGSVCAHGGGAPDAPFSNSS